MEPEKIPGVVYQNRGTALDYRLYEGYEGHVYNYEWNRAIKIGMGEIKEIQENEMVASIGASDCFVFVAKTHDGRVYIGHTEDEEYTNAQKQILHTTIEIVGGGGARSFQKDLEKQFPEITRITEIKRMTEGHDLNYSLSIAVNTEWKMIVYDWRWFNKE